MAPSTLGPKSQVLLIGVNTSVLYSRGLAQVKSREKVVSCTIHASLRTVPGTQLRLNKEAPTKRNSPLYSCSMDPFSCLKCTVGMRVEDRGTGLLSTVTGLAPSVMI